MISTPPGGGRDTRHGHTLDGTARGGLRGDSRGSLHDGRCLVWIDSIAHADLGRGTDVDRVARG